MKNEDLFLCIDAGTSRFKAAAVSGSGRFAARAECGYEAVQGAFHQYTGDDFKTSLTYAAGELKKRVKFERIAGIGITGHGPMLIPVGPHGTPLYPGVGYLDERVARYIGKLAEKRSDRITSTMYVPIGLFFKEEHPEIYGKTHRFLQSFDYIASLLTNDFVAASSASGADGLLPWDEDKVAGSGLDVRKFPPIRFLGEEVGRTDSRLCVELGIPRGIPVYAIGVDFAAALVGTGALSTGKSCERAGSSGGINLCWSEKVNDARLLCYRHIVPGHWNVAGIMSTYGKAYEWAGSLFAPPADGEEIAIEDAVPDIIFLPYLKGERTPLWNPSARGVFYGLRLDHDRSHMMRAVLGGIAMNVRESMEIMEENGCEFEGPVISTGGGSSDPGFMQMKADCTGKPFGKIQVDDAELLGTAVIQAKSAGFFNDLARAAEKIVKVERVFEPDGEKHARYSALFERYKEIRDRVAPLFRE